MDFYYDRNPKEESKPSGLAATLQLEDLPQNEMDLLNGIEGQLAEINKAMTIVNPAAVAADSLSIIIRQNWIIISQLHRLNKQLSQAE